MHKAVILCDIDGVLNSTQSANYRHKQVVKGKAIKPYAYDDFCHICLSNLETILENVPDSKIVITSSWRLGRTIEEMKDIFVNQGFEYVDSIIDMTPFSEDHCRGVEIKAWLNQNPTEKYVVLDDQIHDIVGLIDPKYVIGTSFRMGLTWDHVIKAVSILGGTGVIEIF